MTLSFHVVVDDSLLGLGLGTDPATDGKKCLLSILNDFEDGAWRTDNFETFVWDNIAETALSKRERDALGQVQSFDIDCTTDATTSCVDHHRGAIPLGDVDRSGLVASPVGQGQRQLWLAQLDLETISIAGTSTAKMGVDTIDPKSDW